MTFLTTATQLPQLFGGVHLALLGLTVLLSVVVIWYLRRIRGTTTEAIVVRWAGWFLLAVSVFQVIWYALPANWHIERSLPLHFSDALRFAAAVALIWRVRWAIALTYYWGLTLNPQAIVTPHPTMLVGPSVEFLLYWVLHIAVWLAPLALVWGLGFRVQWRDFGITYGVSVAWAALAMSFNAILGTNYAFLNRPPDGASLVDWLGPWPIYVVWLFIIAALLWALMTWPWTRRPAADADESRAGA